MHRWQLFSIIALTSFVMLLDAQVATAGEWEDLGVEDGVAVSRMQVANSSVLAFRGEVVADVHIARVAQVFLDASQRQYWVDRYHSHETLRRTDTSELYRIRFDLPIGISDRDYVLQANLEIDEDERVFIARIRSVVDRAAPEDRCCVRATTQTYYKFQPVPGEDKTRMIVEVHTDPKGRLPTWLVNRIQSSWPSKTLSQLIARAQADGVGHHPDYADWHNK